MNEKMRELERKSRAAFDARVAAEDAATRARLARARATALEALHRGHVAGPAVWVPAGAAAAAVVAALLWQREAVVSRPPETASVAFEDFDIVAGGEDFEILSEDADFVAWAVGEMADGVG